jgi:DNA recombination protein RmuC
MVLNVLILVLLLVLGGGVLWLISCVFEGRKEIAGQVNAMNLLQQQLEGLRGMQEIVRQSMDKSLQNGQENISKSLEQHHKTLNEVYKQIGDLQGTSRQLINLNTDVRRLHDVLNSPKLRGQMGEWSLEKLLCDLLPKESFCLQHQFNDGKRVDALIMLNNFSVSVDAKFPLPSFEAMLNCQSTDGELTRLQKQFRKDVMTHVDKIAQSYIKPAEGTLDFALMYIPAENVYYETIIKYEPGETSLVDYALNKKVIPVSPNVLYAYIMTVVMGLHGLQIEKQAAQIRENLKRLDSSFATFASDFKTLGNHIRNTSNKYDEADKKLGRFENQLNQIKTEEPV